MSSIFKRFLGITLSVIGLLSFFAFAKAQNSTNDFVNLQPQIYVKDLVLDKTAYKAGDTVTGSFIAINGRNFGSQNITYKIFLVGDYNQNGGLYAYEWDNQQFGPVSFNKNEAKTIKFSYKLPLSSEGYSQGKQLGIKVWFFSSNAAPLGWTDTFVTVSGSTIPSLKLIDASINVDGKNFGLQDGPTLYPNKTASLNLTLTNPSSKDISVVPNLTIYSMQSTQTPVSTTIGGSVVLKANITDTVKVTLPSFSDKPGVYIGEVVLKDQNGVARTGVIRFRYIVYGDVVNVSSIISDKTSFKAGDTLGIKMIYTGSPIDITTIGSFATSTVNMADLSVKVFNENDQLVGEYDSKINTTDVNTQLFNINTKVGAKALYATAVFTKDGKQIGYYKSELSSDFSAIKDQSEKQKMYSIFSIVALIIVLFIIGFFLMKRFKIKKNIILPTFLFVLFALFSLPSMTLAATTYTVSFNSQSATTAASPTTKSVVSPATTVGTLPTDPIRTGYLFDGWYTSTGGGGSQFTASTVVTSTRTVYANWTAIYYTVTFDSQGGSSVASKTILQDNAVGTLSTPTRTGYDFNGWSTAANGGGTSFTSANIITANITVYANWTAKSYRLTYDDNGGSGQPAYETHTTDSVFNLSATMPTKTGYGFGGWNTNNTGTGTNYASGASYTMPGVATTLYANWTAIYYTVTFDSQGGSSVASKTILQDNAVGTLSTPTRTGYDFNGWSTAANGGGTSFTSANIITANITVYANWTAKSYRLTYDDNGGSGQPAYETHTTDSVFNLSATMPTKTGYGFGGWNTNNTGTGTNYASGASYTMPGVATTLYANWTANYTYTVTFDSQDATTLANPTTRTINSPVTTVLLPTAPTRTDYVFKGWYTAVGGGGSSFTASTVVVHDITVYAMWIGKPGAPTDVTAVAGDRQATVSFTPPVSNGFSPITSYTVTSSGGQTATGTASPITVTGLHNGYSYTFTVKATNSPITGTITGTGTGPASSPSNAVTPIYTFVQSGWTIIGAGNWLVTGWENGGVPNITLSSPLPAGMQYYNAGDTIHIQGSSYMPACSNGSGKDLQVFAKPLRLASDEPDFLSNSEPLGTVDSFYYTYNVIKNSLGGYYNPLDIIKDLLGGKTNTIHFMKIYGGATTGTATCNGVSTEIQICVTDTFAGDYAIPSDTPNGIYRLYILGQNDIGRAGSGSNGTDPAAGNSQVLGYQDIQVGESPVYGSCGSSATTTSSIPTTNLCATGTSTAVTGTGPWSWSCIGSNGGTTAPCTANKTVVVNGSCGSSATTTSSIPTTNLCATGTSTAVTGTGPWSWSCIGSNGGTTAPCTANKSPTDGNSVCPNNIKESGETCDGTDLGGASCTSLGFTGGTLSCNSCSSYNTSSCTSNTGGGRPGTPTSGELGDISGILIQTSSSCGGKVNISWDPYAGASKYILRYVKTGNVDYTSTYVREVSAIADGLTPNTSYSFDVQAVDSSESALTNISTDKIATSSSACGGSGGGISGNYTCLSYQNGVSSPTVLLNSQMYWGTSDIPTNASSVQTKWKIGEYTYTGLNVPMIYTTVGKKTISAMIFGTTTVGTTFSGTCVASTTVIVGNGGFQEI